MSIAEELQKRLELIHSKMDAACHQSGRKFEDVRLIAVTKTKPVAIVQELIDLGVRDIGENRTVEIEQKVPLLRGTYTMHMIGHLQTNKVTKVLPYVQWIQSIDRTNLIDRIERVAAESQNRVKVLVEVNTSGEEAKSGCAPQECRAICERVMDSPVMELQGLMTIGPLGADETMTRKSFALLRELAFRNSDLVKSMQLSMGMSGDFEWAIQEGSTMIRVGSLLVGGR